MKILNKLSEIFTATYTYLITFLGFAIILGITLINMINTCFLNTGEHVYQTSDSVILNLLVVVASIVILTIIKGNNRINSYIENLESDEALFKKCRNVLLFVIFSLSVIWVLMVQSNPGADQEFIQNAILAVKNKDYSDFMSGGYMSKYPNQIGFFVVSYLYSLIFGDKNYIGLQLINAIGVTFFYKVLCDIQAELGFKKLYQLFVSIIGILFLPLIFYSTFVYGTVLGLLLSTLAIKHEIKYFKNYKLKDILISAFAIAIAIMLKNNFLIVFVAIVLYAIVEIIAQKKWNCSWTLLVLLITFIMQSTIPTMVVEKATGTKLDSGIASLSWVAMGLQESPLENGWYNGYNEGSYLNNNCSPKEQTKVVKEDIRKALDKFKKDGNYSLIFFTSKVSSMWSEPTYESVWVSQIRNTDIKTSTLAWSLLTVAGSYPIIIFLNFFQIIVLFGVLLYFVLCRNHKYYRQSLIFMMTFIGGFLFHLVWEAKGQYSMTYYVLMFPYAIAGIFALVDLLNSHFSLAAMAHGLQTSNKSDTTATNSNDLEAKPTLKNLSAYVDSLSISNVIISCIVIFNLAMFIVFSSNGVNEKLYSGTKEFEEYLHTEKDKVSTNIADGEYIMTLAIMGNSNISFDDKGNDTASLVFGSDSHSVTVTTRKGISHISFTGTNFYIDEYNSEVKEHEYVEARSKSDSIGQDWTILPAGDGSYYITHYNDYTLTYDTLSCEIYVGTNTHAENQRWIFKPVNK